jgi:lysophospholipase L1-like esterase
MRSLRLPASLLALALAVPAGAVFAVNTGQADFTHYVSVGDSLTAGFTSGSLIDISQRVDYPALIELQATGSNSGFQQPLVSPPGIPAILSLKGLFPAIISPSSSNTGHPENLNLPRPYDNLAVPGENVHSMINTVTDHGGLHDLILRGLGTQLQQAAGSHPTFLTVWIGNNDALAAATSGIVVDGVTLTTLASFQADYTTIIHTLAATGAKMALANIPDVTTIPFVNTIPPVVVNPHTNQPVMINGQLVPLIGPAGPLHAGDHVLLTAAAHLSQGIGIPLALGGTGQPLADSDVLSADETARVQARVQQFNGVIQAQANAVGAAYVDANALLTQLATQGVEIGGLNFSSAFLTGGVFSYDGVHPTAFGYAFIANAFIQAINAQFGAQIPLADLSGAIFGTSATSGAAASDQEAAGQAKRMAAPAFGILTDEAIHQLFQTMNWPEPGTITSDPPPPTHRRRHHHSS